MALQPVCRVKASIPAAIWTTPPAPLPHRVRGHPRLQPPPAEIRFIGHTAWRRHCDRHSPRGVFFDGTVLFPAELPAIDCRPTIWRHLPVLLTGFLRVACVEFGRHIELGVTFRRCVSSKPAHPVGPTGVAREHVIVMGGMGAVDHVVSWSCTRSPLNRLDCGPERVA